MPKYKCNANQQRSSDMKILVKTTDFVEASDLFENCRGAWNAFANSEPNCSWGANNRTLINSSYIASILEQYDSEDDGEEVPKQIQTVQDRIKELKDDFYVDLEN